MCNTIQKHWDEKWENFFLFFFVHNFKLQLLLHWMKWKLYNCVCGITLTKTHINSGKHFTDSFSIWFDSILFVYNAYNVEKKVFLTHTHTHRQNPKIKEWWTSMWTNENECFFRVTKKNCLKSKMINSIHSIPFFHCVKITSIVVVIQCWPFIFHTHTHIPVWVRNFFDFRFDFFSRYDHDDFNFN